MKRSIGLRTQARSCTAGSCGPLRRDERPVRLILGPGGDPALEHFLLRGGELLVRGRRRHHRSWVGRRRSARPARSSGLARHDGPHLDGGLAAVEPQVGLAAALSGPWQAKHSRPGSAECRGCSRSGHRRGPAPAFNTNTSDAKADNVAGQWHVASCRNPSRGNSGGGRACWYFALRSRLSVEEAA